MFCFVGFAVCRAVFVAPDEVRIVSPVWHVRSASLEPPSYAPDIWQMKNLFELLECSWTIQIQLDCKDVEIFGPAFTHAIEAWNQPSLVTNSFFSMLAFLMTH